MERRERNRVDLRLQCRVQAVIRGGGESWQETRNISRSGMLIRWDPAAESNRPMIGEPITIELSLPRNPLFDQRCMFFQAKVVRVSGGRDDASLVAVRIERSRMQKQLAAYPVLEASPAYVN